MSFFFDTSALLKLYVREQGSDRVETLVSRSADLGGGYVSELSTVEVVSAIMGKMRQGRITQSEALQACQTFRR